MRQGDGRGVARGEATGDRGDGRGDGTHTSQDACAGCEPRNHDTQARTTSSARLSLRIRGGGAAPLLAVADDAWAPAVSDVSSLLPLGGGASA